MYTGIIGIFDVLTCSYKYVWKLQRLVGVVSKEAFEVIYHGLHTSLGLSAGLGLN